MDRDLHKVVACLVVQLYSMTDVLYFHYMHCLILLSDAVFCLPQLTTAQLAVGITSRPFFSICLVSGLHA
jgi:hypothetical protein